MKKVSIRPSRPVSLLGFIIGICFIVLGVFYAIPNLGLFGIVWTIGAAVITIFYAINLFSEKGISFYQVTIEEKDKDKK